VTAEEKWRSREGVRGRSDRVDRLVRENLGLVYDAAKQLAHSGGMGPERGDLVSAGGQGLIQAASSFDPERGLAFSTLAVTRIRGAMLDEMRRWDGAPRSVRKRERTLREAEEELQAQLGRAPSSAEIANHLGVSAEDLHGWSHDVARHAEASLDDGPSSPSPDSETRPSLSELVPDRAPTAADVVDRRETVALLSECIATLPERESRVLALYYFEDLRLREIADLMGVSESRISQIRHAALKTLRSMLQQRGVER